MKRKYRFSRIVSVVLAFCIISLIGCTKDDGIELDENGEVKDPKPDSQIVSGDPTLNDFLITGNDEGVYTVNAETGEETEIFVFSNLTDLEGVADYDNGRIYVTTDRNAINAIDVASKNLV